jgi:hypothetical protein
MIEKIVYFIYGAFLCLLAMTLALWYAQSRQAVVTFDDNPGYRILEITDDFIEVKWINARLVTNCPGFVQPIFIGEYASHALGSYPFIVQHETKTFARRYEIPDYFPYGDYLLKIVMVAVCNPLFETRQEINVEFRYDPRNLMEYN